MMRTTMRKLLTFATIPVAIITAHNLPDWLSYIGGAFGMGWWIYRYAQWTAWEARRAEIRRTGR